MNASSFWPLVWKEYRTGRAFWLAMATIALLLQASRGGRRSVVRPRLVVYAIALTIAAGFMVGVGATMFAVEREEQTFGFVRRLPVRPWQLAAQNFVCPGGLGSFGGSVVAGGRGNGRLAVSLGPRCPSALDPLGRCLAGMFGLGDFFLAAAVESAEGGGAGDVGGLPGELLADSLSWKVCISRH